MNAINGTAQNQTDSKLNNLAKDLEKLLHLYDLILDEEYGDLKLKTHANLKSSFNDDTRIVCDFCECDIFQNFFECRRCMGGLPGSRIICPGCYSEGRSCGCEWMRPTQCRNHQVLFDTRTEAVDVLQCYMTKTGTTDICLKYAQTQRNMIALTVCYLANNMKVAFRDYFKRHVSFQRHKRRYNFFFMDFQGLKANIVYPENLEDVLEISS